MRLLLTMRHPQYNTIIMYFKECLCTHQNCTACYFLKFLGYLEPERLLRWKLLGGLFGTLNPAVTPEMPTRFFQRVHDCNNSWWAQIFSGYPVFSCWYRDVVQWSCLKNGWFSQYFLRYTHNNNNTSKLLQLLLRSGFQCRHPGGFFWWVCSVEIQNSCCRE